MKVSNRIVSAMTGLFGERGWSYVSAMSQVVEGGMIADDPGLFNLCRLMYYNNAVYQQLLAMRLDHIDKSQYGLRNPTNAAIEFYPATLWPGASLMESLPIVAENEKWPAVAYKLLAASNMASRKQVMARWQPMLGNLYIKVATKPERAKPERVFLEFVEPDFVSERQVDERGYITHIRVDTADTTKVNGVDVTRWYIEVWDKADGVGRFYTVEGARPETARLPKTPEYEVSLASLGSDFVPFVHIKHRDDGTALGVPEILPAYDKIREMDRLASRLHDSIYAHNRPYMVIEGAMRDIEGFATPPPQISQDNSTSTIQVAGEEAYALPAGWTLSKRVADVHYSEHLEALTSHYDHLADTDLPVLNYYKLGSDSAALSGRAIRYKLTPAIARALEARGNGEDGIMRAVQMAYTISRKLMPERVDDVGTFEKGDLDSAFEERNVIPSSELDDAELANTRATAYKTLTDAGVEPEIAAKAAGFPDKTAADFAANNGDVPPVTQ